MSKGKELEFDLPKRNVNGSGESKPSKMDEILDKLKELGYADLKAIADESQVQMAIALEGQQEDDYEKWSDIFSTVENELHFKIESLFNLND